MEILDALEQKVTELLKEVAALRERNTELENIITSPVQADDGENDKIAKLEAALLHEQKLREAVLEKVSALVKRLEEDSSAG